MNGRKYQDLLSGETRGLAAQCIRCGLSCLACLYGWGMHLRNRTFDRGLRQVHRLPAPVISVGNLTAGGTGKTPIVAYLAKWLQTQQARPAILSRGYGAQAGEANDEKRVLDLLCPGVPHYQHPDRVAAAAALCEQHTIDVLILDDGFQHRRAARDLDILLIDALNPWGFGHVLPRGLLREPLKALRRADLIIITRADQAQRAAIDDIGSTIRRFNPTCPVCQVRFLPIGLRSTTGQTAPLESVQTGQLAAFCGIGHPQAFWKTLEDLSAEVVWKRSFPDHHRYTSSDVQELTRRVSETGISAVLTTLKDLVKLKTEDLAGRRLWAVDIETRFLDGEDLLTTRAREILAQDTKLRTP